MYILVPHLIDKDRLHIHMMVCTSLMTFLEINIFSRNDHIDIIGFVEVNNFVKCEQVMLSHTFESVVFPYTVSVCKALIRTESKPC